ncbi:methyl-accepting chemotaxis protein [Azospirillum sp. HJ39]|uniref:methyl-accepting chemotaxis protein n=1 Tax=Azospirillum sp. HJ39 TaxID=3159496 RepID=UPI003558E268
MKKTFSVPIVGKVVLILAILAATVFAGIARITAIQADSETVLTGLVEHEAAGLIWLARARATAMNVTRLTFEMTSEPSGFRARQIGGRLKEETVTFAVRMTDAERSLPAGTLDLKIARDAFDRLGQRIDVVAAAKFAAPDGPPGEALRDLTRAVTTSAEEFDGLMTKLIDQGQELAARRAHDASARAHADSTMVIRLVALALVAVLVFAFLLMRMTVVRPLHRLIALAKELLGGRLDLTVPGVARGDEVGDIARMVQLLKDTMASSDELARRTHIAAQQMAAATAQAAVAVEQVSDGSQRQMQAVEAITGSVSRTTAIIGTIASVSLSAKDRSRDAATQLASGLTQIAAMTAAVQEISVTSARINAITQSIGELATRSNILSLNAAIEAARAGEHGRGFSVVAEEVGNLAQQTADLAQEIALLAADSTDRIQKGVSMATQVGGVMNAVTAAIDETDSLSEDIAQSMEEQGGMLRQIEQSLQRLTDISNANATAGEEISTTMMELTRLADGTRRQAESVRRGGGDGPAATVAGAASATGAARAEAMPA